MLRLLLILIFSLLNFLCFSQQQKTHYVDEQFETISFNDYKKHLASDMFFENIITSDTAVFKKLRFKEFYGKIEANNKQQMNKLFNKLYNIDSTKTWLIHYKDTLPNIKTMPKESKIVYLDSSKTIHKHLLSYKDDVEIIARELKYYEKLTNVKLLHFYQLNLGYPVDIKGKEWHHDYSSILRKTISDGLMPYNWYIIHPNGDIYVTSINISPRDQKKILNPTKFKKMKVKFEKKYSKF